MAKPRQTNLSYCRDVIGGSEKEGHVPDLLISVIISMDVKVFHRGVGTILSALLPPPAALCSVLRLGSPGTPLQGTHVFCFPGDWGFIKS